MSSFGRHMARFASNSLLQRHNKCVSIYATASRFDISTKLNYDFNLTCAQNSNFSTNTTLCNRIQKFILPDIGEGIKEVTIKQWQVDIGDSVSEFDPICEVESDKATASISSRFNGKIVKIYHQVGSTAEVGKALVDIELVDEGNNQTSQKAAQRLAPAESESKAQNLERPEAVELGNVATLPSVRRLAREHGVDLSKVKASGKHNRILKEDLLNYLQNGATSQEQLDECSKQNSSPNALGDQTKRVALRSIQKAMYKSMTSSLQVPHFNYSEEIDLSLLLAYLKAAKSSQPQSVSSFAFFIKMVSLALLEYPELNAVIDSDKQHLVHKLYHNIGVAVDTQNGLVVPNIKNVQTKSVVEINNELLRLRQLAYDSKLSPQDLTGGTITLSNIGAIGGIFGVPVIVTPEIVIGALGRARTLPRFNNQGQVEARQIMQVVWSADHRVVDGATLSRFSNLLKRLLEQPQFALERLH